MNIWKLFVALLLFFYEFFSLNLDSRAGFGRFISKPRNSAYLLRLWKLWSKESLLRQVSRQWTLLYAKSHYRLSFLGIFWGSLFNNFLVLSLFSGDFYCRCIGKKCEVDSWRQWDAGERVSRVSSLRTSRRWWCATNRHNGKVLSLPYFCIVFICAIADCLYIGGLPIFRPLECFKLLTSDPRCAVKTSEVNREQKYWV